MFSRLLHSLPLPRIPSQCAVCRAWPSQAVCSACVAQFAMPVARCRRCALPVSAALLECGACLKAAPPLDACFAAVAYTYPWSDCISNFKYKGNPGWARTLAELLRDTPGVVPALAQADWLLPMPLSSERLRERGFNQALELARRLAPAKTDAGMLLRVRNTAPQSALTRAERASNMKNAFALDPLRAAALRGRHVVVLDDVMTSGASLYCAAQALREGGAATVTGVVLARTAVN